VTILPWVLFLLTIHSRGVILILLIVHLKSKSLMKKLIKPLALLLTLLPASLMAVPTTPTTIVGFSSFNDDNTQNASAMAQSFTTDASAWTLTGVVLNLANPSATSQGAFTVGLYADNAGAVGSLIGSLTTAQTSFFTNPFGGQYSFQNILFTNNAITLAASSTYWVGVSNSNNDIYWEGLFGINQTGVGTYGTTLLDDAPATSYTPLNVTVNGTAVPEPSTYALMGLGALALVIAARRRTA